MIRRRSFLLSVVVVFALSISVSLAQQSPAKSGSRAAQDYTSVKLGNGVWHIEDRNRDSMYLVEGSEKAALIDTGMGSGDLPGYVRTLTRLPAIALIIHGHGDHTGQANLFSTIYFPQKDSGAKVRFDISKTNPLTEGQRVDLGGKDLEVIEIPGHTAGSVAFLDANDHMIFTGDAIGTSYVWNHIGGRRLSFLLSDRQA